MTKHTNRQAALYTVHLTLRATGTFKTSLDFDSDEFWQELEDKLYDIDVAIMGREIEDVEPRLPDMQ